MVKDGSKPKIEVPKSPPLLKGVPTTDINKLLAEATPEQIKALTYDNFALWAQFSGLEVDNRPFSFDERRYLLPIYLDNSHELILIKAAQMGATIFMLLKLLWFARHNTVKCGMYFPTADGVKVLSKDRLTPLINSNAELRENIKDSGDTLGLKQLNNIHNKVSSIYMSYLGGVATLDSTPMDIIAVDEVRLVDPKLIDQAQERLSASPFKYKMFFSTSGMPNDTIDKRYKEGTQHVWTCKCNCLEGFVPSERFPECIVEYKGEVYLRCPRCKYRILDPQNGSYIPRRTDPSLPHSYSISQLISKQTSVKEIWDFYKRTTNIREFYNSKLGRPYIDEDARPISREHLDNIQSPDIKWAYDPTNKRKISSYKRVAMGVDQRGGQNHVTIMALSPDNKKQIIHIEEIDSANPRYWEDGKPVTPFKRLYELMREFNVDICIIDAMPNHNEALQMVHTFPAARCFMSYFSEGAGPDSVKYGDRVKMKEAVRRTGRESKTKYTVTMRRYDVIDQIYALIRSRNISMPNIREISQIMRNPETGFFEQYPIGEVYFKHLLSMVREVEPVNEKTNDLRTRQKYVYIDTDPHFLFSLLFACQGLIRLSRTPIWV